jgi:acetyl esterase/lipase
VASDELAFILELIGSQEQDTTVEGRRQRLDATGASVPLLEGTQSEAAEAGGVPAEWVWNGGERPSSPVILYTHGGAYTSGSLVSHRPYVARLAHAAGAAVLHIDYRLGPEHPFPAAVDDALTAYRWLLAEGTDPSRLAVAGDSAGGGLALALLVALRDAGDPLPAAATLFSPWTDLTLSGDSAESRNAVDVMLTKEELRIEATNYLGGADARDPLASPVFADLSGLPPLLLEVGDPEVLLDDSTRVAERATAAGTEVDLRVWPEVFHVWIAAAGLMPEADAAMAEVVAWLDGRLTRR